MTAPVGEVTTPITSGSQGRSCLRAAKTGDLAADADVPVGVLHRPLQGQGELGDGEFGRVEQLFRGRHRQMIRHFGVEADVKDFRSQAPTPALTRRVLYIIEFSIDDKPTEFGPWRFGCYEVL